MLTNLVHHALTCEEGYTQLSNLAKDVVAFPDRQRAITCFAVEMVMPKLNCRLMRNYLKMAGEDLNRKGLDSLVTIVNAYDNPAEFKRLCK